MSLAPRILPNYTYEDYLRWEGRWEIIDGIAYDMSPAARPDHQVIGNNIGWVFKNALLKANCKSCKVYQPIDVKIDESNVVNPDLLIVCKKIESQYLDSPPELVVEIISPSSKLKDLHTKYDLYRKFGVKYYLIVDAEKHTIDIYELDPKGEYQAIPIDSEFLLSDDCTIKPDLNQIWE